MLTEADKAAIKRGSEIAARRGTPLPGGISGKALALLLGGPEGSNVDAVRRCVEHVCEETPDTFGILPSAADAGMRAQWKLCRQYGYALAALTTALERLEDANRLLSEYRRRD